MNLNLTPQKWDGTTTLKFVNLYHKHPCLWDSKSVHYKNQQTRMQAYISLANEMGIPGFGVPEVKTKIKNLRSTFSQEVKKIRQNKYYEPNLRWYKAMENVYIEMLSRRQGLEIVESNEDAAETKYETKFETSHDSNDAANDTDCEELETEVLEDEIFVQEFPAPPPKKKLKINLNNSPKFLRMSHTDPLNSSIDNDTNSFDIFGRSVAAQLKNLSPRNALLAKSQIQNILTEYGIKDLNKEAPNLEDNSDRKWMEADAEENIM